MKRSEALQVIREYLDINNGNLVPEQVLAIVEKIGMLSPDSYYDEDQGIVSYWEMEDEEYERLVAEEKKFWDTLPHNLPTSRINSYTKQPMQMRRHEMAMMWNNGSTIQEIADTFKVTRYRVESCLKQVYSEMNKESK